MSRLIDADKLPEHKFTRESAKGSDYMRGWNDAIDAIVDNAPTACNDNYSMGYQDGVKKVLSERPQGEWLEDSGNIACSHCHTIWLYRKTDFCPHCGADMREAEDEVN